jgi:predicted AlkP superfamily pyrophosphatase or phosphodiesterase
LLFFSFFLFSALSVHAQERPKLVVGIVVDQMKADYLYRFNEHYSDKGFKKLIREGAEIKNLHYNYIPTYTGPGHASVYTGTTTAMNAKVLSVSIKDRGAILPAGHTGQAYWLCAVHGG